MYKRLQELGIPSVIIRDTDETLPKAERIERVLEAYNNSPNTILVSNHMNAGGGEGAEIIYALRNDDTLSTMALNNIASAGQVVRNVYQRVLPEDPSKDYYYILRETGNTEPILVEYGFIDNTRDANRLRNNLERYVEGVVKAIADYAGYQYTSPTEENYYIVQKGDTLYSIARRYNTTVDELKRLNNLTSNTLTVGTQLIISAPLTTPTEVYTVVKGDTLYSIAQKYNTTIQELKTINNLINDTLSIGQQLLIPNITIPEEPIPSQTYIVQKGDSLWSISKRYNTTVNELISLNNLSTIDLQIGDVLLIPSSDVIEPSIYTVKSGDTLWSIAKNNNITVDELKTANNLTNNLLAVGQQLLIP